jgi:signal transduction histidine kinase
MFTLFAQLVGLHLENERRIEFAEAALLDERATGELREQFVAVLGHDLRNPLNAVAACAQVLERKSTDPALAAVATRLMNNVRRMSTLIDDVLDFARARLGSGIGVRMQDVDDLDAALVAVVAELGDAEPQRTIVTRIAVGQTVRCDRGRLQQLASNLLSNALTHGAPVAPIELIARIEGAELVLQVANDGASIPADSLARIFEPFFGQSTAGDQEGLGLGLHICAQIVRAHGGRLDVESTNDGTRFTARIPRMSRHDRLNSGATTG